MTKKLRNRFSAALAAAPPKSVDAPTSHREIMVILSALMLAMLLAALDQTIVATALPKIAVDLHGLNKYSWVATSYLMTSAIATPIYGKVGDLLGRKRVFQSAIIIFFRFGTVRTGPQYGSISSLPGPARHRRRWPN